MRTLLQTLLLGSLTVNGSLAGEVKNLPADGPKGFTWESPLPADCPFEKSTSLTGIFFTGRHSDYQCGDTWYPCWASDGNLYSPWTDGKTDGVVSESYVVPAQTGHAVMIGEDPLRYDPQHLAAQAGQCCALSRTLSRRLPGLQRHLVLWDLLLGTSLGG